MCHQCLMTNNRQDGEPYWLHAQPVTRRITANAKQTVAQDPTQQAGVRRRAIAELRKRLKGAQTDVLALFDSIPTRTIQTNAVRYVYEVAPARVNSIDALIREIVNGWFATQTDRHPARWFFDPFIEQPARSATVESANRISMLSGQAGYSSAMLTQLEVSIVLMSEPYRRRIELLYGRVFN